MKKNILVLLMSMSLQLILAQTVSKYIVVDQFGYQTDSKKIAVIRDPVVGFDAAESFTPGRTYQVINKQSGKPEFSGTPVVWEKGITDKSSGDKCWWFDFSSVVTSSDFYILDIENNVKSYEFSIQPNVYKEVLKQAVRSFYYQRSGIAKVAEFAGEGWVDAASHLGTLQDKNCRLYNSTNEKVTERDMSGGWYDAGDYNKYVNFTWGVLIDMLTAYEEKPSIWGDDYNIPESKNGIPDILDEVKWELDWLLKMQDEDGSVFSIVGVSSASPPSSAKGPSVYGSVSTSATLTCAGVFALASKVYASLKKPEYIVYADTLKKRAIKAWKWADKNRKVLFYNNLDQAPYFSKGLAAGQQEISDYDRMVRKLAAAEFLFNITKNKEYNTFFVENYQRTNLMLWDYMNPFEMNEYTIMNYYAKVDGASKNVVMAIKNQYKTLIHANKDSSIINKDPYIAYLKDYVWGSNMFKCKQGMMFYDLITYKNDIPKAKYYKDLAQSYINYIHGVNPLQKVYLTNMNKYGAENSANEMYHSWFEDGSNLWDNVQESKYGPPPGFIVGGANPSYKIDDCCSNDTQCYNSHNYSKCSKNVSPPANQPTQKSFKDFNDGWPLNSWSVTENGIYYNSAYIKLLSKFVAN